MAHSRVLLVGKVIKLRAANNATSERKKRTKKRIQKGGDLLQAEAEETIA
jgi:hypothetical protein